MVMENQQKNFRIIKKLNLSKFNTQKKLLLKLKTVLLIGGYGKIDQNLEKSLKKYKIISIKKKKI